MLDNMMSILMSIRIADIVDIAIVAYLIYKILGFIRETRAQQLVRGILLILVIYIVSDSLGLSLLTWMLKSLITIGLFGLIVLFQPELRRGLESLGRKFSMFEQFRDIDKDAAIANVKSIVDAVEEFAATRTGALIAIERDTMLNEFFDTGVIVDANISSRLLGNLFYEGSPLHDGAVMIRGSKIKAASCVLPLTEKVNIGGNLGTRHRAGVGLSEVSDALVVIVSEESGAISIAEHGSLRRFVDIKALEKKLLDIYLPTESRADRMRSRIKGGGK